MSPATQVIEVIKSEANCTTVDEWKLANSTNQITKLIAYLVSSQCDMENKIPSCTTYKNSFKCYQQFSNQQEATTITL